MKRKLCSDIFRRVNTHVVVIESTKKKRTNTSWFRKVLTLIMLGIDLGGLFIPPNNTTTTINNYTYINYDVNTLVIDSIK